MTEDNLLVDDNNLSKSKYTQRDELRNEIHQTVGDAESLFSVDSDLLQVITYSLINLFEAIENNVEFSSILENVDADVLKSIGLLSKGLKDQSLLFPIDTKRQYKSEEDIVNKINERYTETSICLNDYYRKRMIVDESGS